MKCEEPLSFSGIVDLASAFYGSSVLFAALELRIFSLIAQVGGAADLEKIAELTGASHTGLRLLLDGCVAVGLLQKMSDGHYANTEAGAMALVEGAPADLSQAIAYNRDVYGAWGKLSALVRTGKPVESPSLHLGEDAGRTRRFALSMRSRALAIGRCVAPRLPLQGARQLLDLAGGPGAFAELIVRANPGLRCVTVDLPAISAVAKECVQQAGLQDRIECRVGDYHTDEYETEKYDAVTIFGALHQESPEDIVAILKRAARALRPGGAVYVLDMMTDSTRAFPRFSALFAVNMALTTEHGWVFSDRDLAGWMEQAGFDACPVESLAPQLPHWLMRGVKR